MKKISTSFLKLKRKTILGQWLLITFVFCVTSIAYAHGMSEAEKQTILEGGNLQFMKIGATHMLTGYDHLLFVFGIVFFLTTFIPQSYFSTLLVCSWKWSSSRLIRFVATLIFILVCIQGLLGGLRVTGFLTMTQDRAVLTPNVWIGVVHGVVGQLIFAICICLTALWSAGWNQPAKMCQKKDSKIATK